MHQIPRYGLLLMFDGLLPLGFGLPQMFGKFHGLQQYVCLQYLRHRYSIEGGLCVSCGTGNSGTLSVDGTVVLYEVRCDACSVSTTVAGGIIGTKPALGYALTEGSSRNVIPLVSPAPHT